MSGQLDGLFGLWTTSEIAIRMGVSDTEVSRWRSGRRRPKPERIRQLGDTLAALRAFPSECSNGDVAAARAQVAEAVAADAASRRRVPA